MRTSRKFPDWKLLTNDSVKTFEDAVERISWYKKRWNIETDFKVLKSGCKVEDCRFETAERLTRYLPLMSIIAWRLFWMIQNDLDAGAEQTSIIFTENKLICEGNGQPVDEEGWDRLTFIRGAGDLVLRKRNRIGIKNQGLNVVTVLKTHQNHR